MCKLENIRLNCCKEELFDNIIVYIKLLMCLKDFEESEGKKEQSTNMEKSHDCPLCLEPLELDDKNFFPCACGYQVCRFCWHRIRTNENGLCPACRRTYPENPVNFQPLTQEDIQKLKHQKKMKEMQKKQKLAENRKMLANIRVIQKNLVFAVGLPLEIAQDPQKKEKVFQLFRQFGVTHKEAITDRTSYAGSQGPSACAYITYQKAEDAVNVVKSLSNTKIEGKVVKVSLGTTKYCSNFLKNAHCPKSDCLYLHELADEEASFTKEDIHLGKHLEYEQKLLEQTLQNMNHTKTSVSNQELNRLNYSNHNLDNCSESSDDTQNSTYNSSDLSDLSPSSNSHLESNRCTDVDSKVETKIQNGSSFLNSSDISNRFPNPGFKLEDDFIVNNHSPTSSQNPSGCVTSTSNHLCANELESLQESNFLHNRVNGQLASPSESTFLKFITSSHETGSSSSDNQTNLSRKFDDPDLEFDPCQVSLKGLQDLLISEARERARIHYNSLNRSPVGNRSPTLSVPSPEAASVRTIIPQPLRIRDPPPGFTAAQNFHNRSPYDVGYTQQKTSPLVHHNQLGMRSNFSLQRLQQPGVSFSNSAFVQSEFPPQNLTRELPDMQHYMQQNPRYMNFNQTPVQFPEQRTSPIWSNSSQSQWRPMESLLYNQSLSENRLSNEVNVRMQQQQQQQQQQLRATEASMRQWQQMNGSANSMSPFSDLPQPMTNEQIAKIQAMYKAFELNQRNSGIGQHRLQYTKKL